MSRGKKHLSGSSKRVSYLGMGMHFGVIAAKSKWPALFEELKQAFGDFADHGPVADVSSPPFGDAEDGIIAGEYGDACFILDDHLVLSSTSHDALLKISQTLDCLVASCVGETVSGTFELFVADKGRLVRVYSNCASGMTEPLQIGSPLQSESDSPLEDIDGRGLFDAMRSVGLDFEAWYRQGHKRAFVWEFDEAKFSELMKKEGAIAKAMAEHQKKFAIPKGQQPKPTVVTRKLPDGSVGFDIVSQMPGARERRSLFSKICSFFGAR